MLRRWLVLLLASLLLTSAPNCKGSSHAITEEDDAGRELDEGLPPTGHQSRFRYWRPPTTGYDLKRTQRFWRSYRLPKVREKPPKRPKEYLDVD